MFKMIILCLQAGLAVGAMAITAVANTTAIFSTEVSEIVW